MAHIGDLIVICKNKHGEGGLIMPKKVDDYFKHMEKVIHGTKHVNNKDNDPFLKHNLKGKGYQCPACQVGFTGPPDALMKVICPCCGHVIERSSN